MRVLIDTNIYLDVALKRQPFAEASLAVIQKVIGMDGTILIAPHSLATIYYMCERQLDREQATELTGNLLQLAVVANFEHQDAVRAFAMGYKDFEDAMVFSTAISNEAMFVVTRNLEDFAAEFLDTNSGYELKVTTPEWFLNNEC
jgi:predicted nucleic acid-binding protein